MRRIAGVVWRPRSTMAAVVAAPTFLTAWTVVLLLWLIPAAWLLSTDVGRQGLVDERVRLAEASGAPIDDPQYAVLQASPPWIVYFATGGRLLMAPPVTAMVALMLVGLARLDGHAMGLGAGMAITVHASAVLALQQLVAIPLQYLRESITSPTNLAALAPMVEDGSAAARVLGAVDVFGIWWIWLLALGLSAVASRPALHYVWRLLAVYVGAAVLMAAMLAVAGGS
ncbi:MAG TPA: hypothetical protein PLH72_16535 [Vicinamibacterales bacterium]|nr:hypothetical protein [Vicinamibacterales bacterium]